MTQPPVFISQDSGKIEDFKKLLDQTVDLSDYPTAVAVDQNVLVYEGATLNSTLSPHERIAIMSELNRALSNGPGIVAIKGAIADTKVIDDATVIFDAIIEAEKDNAQGDHFAKAGANDRVWNALQKHCIADPENFAAYFGTPAIDLISRAWLGDAYQATAQVNRVNPGGAAQTPHRDYHLGFMPVERMEQFPAQVHALSPVLTLQGAIAHCDMPLETGPTVYLPFSQQFFEGYLAFNRPEFQAYFADNYVQLPLEKGDAVFFNPAVMHGSGTNTTTDQFRLANLLQIGSAFGRSIESVDRAAMLKSIYSVLSNMPASPARDAVLGASSEGYSFPTNLDLDPPLGGMNPQSQRELVEHALAEGWNTATFVAALNAQSKRRIA